MFLKSFGLVFLAISLCVQASPAPLPCDEAPPSTSSPGNGNNGGGSTVTRASTATSPAASPSGSGVQASLTLDSNVICSGFAHDGQSTPTPGQVASLTSTNNFINFCAEFPDINLTNGEQLKNGSCNPAPMGLIPSSDKMPSSKFRVPSNLATLKANQSFTIQMAIINMETGGFVNPEKNYYAAPQQLNSKGLIIGHSHFVIQKVPSLNHTTPLDPTKFAFFTAVNSAAVNGVLTARVTDGLLPGTYKLSSINSAANHQPPLVPIAQHGSLDDVIYFFVTSDGKANSREVVDNSQNSKPPTSKTIQSTPTSIPPSTTSVAC